MYDNHPEWQITNKTKSVNQQCSEELLAAREEIEFLRELIESQNLIIHSLKNELVNANEELEIINEELARTLMAGVSFDEAKAVAKQLLKHEQESSVLVTNLLNIIYGLSVEATEFKETAFTEINQDENTVFNQANQVNQVIAKSNKVRQNAEELRSRYLKFRCRYLAFTVHTIKLSEQYNSSPPPEKFDS